MKRARRERDDRRTPVGCWRIHSLAPAELASVEVELVHNEALSAKIEQNPKSNLFHLDSPSPR